METFVSAHILYQDTSVAVFVEESFGNHTIFILISSLSSAWFPFSLRLFFFFFFLFSFLVSLAPSPPSFLILVFFTTCFLPLNHVSASQTNKKG